MSLSSRPLASRTDPCPDPRTSKLARRNPRYHSPLRPGGPPRWLALLLGLCCVVAGASSAAAARAPQANAALRIVHAGPEMATLDVLIDGRPAAALGFGRDTGYLIVPSGPHTVALGPTGAAADGARSVAVDLAPGSLHTVVALPAPAAPLDLNDESLAPVGGPALVRLANAAPGAPPVELTVGGAVATTPPVSYGEASAYAEVAGGTRPLVVRASVGGAPLASIPDATLGGDRAYTFILAGDLAAGSPVNLLPLLDSSAPGMPPLRSPGDVLAGASRHRD